EKSFVSLDTLVESVNGSLTALRDALFAKALAHREERTYSAENLDELKAIADEKNGYIKAMWCGELECELKLKEVADVSSRCMPFGMDATGDKCVCCGREAKKLVYWGKAY
ncbi:MAG: proline--tRNA ligase, partial [Clostridia bacterium]|nr:proline--tRNA ligase [Clostridia bacterium]